MIEDAKAHIEEAIRLLTGEVWRGTGPGDMRPLDGVCVMVMELERIDCALGPRGQSMFAPIADKLQSAYVEIKAARAALSI